jgi:hypothetical protein
MLRSLVRALQCQRFRRQHPAAPALRPGAGQIRTPPARACVRRASLSGSTAQRSSGSSRSRTSIPDVVALPKTGAGTGPFGAVPQPHKYCCSASSLWRLDRAGRIVLGSGSLMLKRENVGTQAFMPWSRSSSSSEVEFMQGLCYLATIWIVMYSKHQRCCAFKPGLRTSTPRYRIPSVRLRHPASTFLPEYGNPTCPSHGAMAWTMSRPWDVWCAKPPWMNVRDSYNSVKHIILIQISSVSSGTWHSGSALASHTLQLHEVEGSIPSVSILAPF